MEKWNCLAGLWRPFRPSEVSLYAAAAVFYLLLSFLPASLLIHSLIHLLPIDLQTAKQTALSWIPVGFHPIFKRLFSVPTDPSPAVLSISALTIIWSAARGVHALMDGINAVTLTGKRPAYLYRRLAAVGYFLLLLPALLLFPILTRFPALQRLPSLLSILVLTFLFTLIYHCFPRRRIPLASCVPGALAAAGGWILFSKLFGIYVNHFSGTETLYGNIGMVILFLLWMQLSLSILLYGCILCQLLHSRSYHPIQILKSLFHTG